MSAKYDAELSKLLAECCVLTYVQYNNGKPPINDGEIDPPAGYEQIASFIAPELDFKKDLQRFSHINFDKPNNEQIEELEKIAMGIPKVYFGFALTSSKNNIIALRGTQSIFEWVLDATIPQVDVPLGWFDHKKFEQAKIHLGFLILFLFLVEQILEAAKKFDSSLPCYITGHSLGAALATLAPVPVKLLTENDAVEMYNYASPRVGNPPFAEAYNMSVPGSYRVVNLADLVAILPPTEVFSWLYEHVGTEWSFLNESGNVSGNHALQGKNNYQAAVNQQIPTDAPRSYPVTGL